MRDLNIESNRSIDRAIDILNTFTHQNPAQTIDEIAAAAKLAKATVYRILYTLELRELIQYDPQTLKYKLGFKLLEYSGMLVTSLDVRQEAEHLLIDLQIKTKQTVLMALPQQDTMVYVFRRENAEGLKYSSFVGQRRPFDYGVLGRVVTAFLPEEQMQPILESYSASQWPGVSSNKQSVRDYLQAIRRDKICVEINQTNIGVTGVGAPVFNVEGQLIAVIGIVGPSVQLIDDHLQEIKDMVKEAANQISQRMGYRDERISGI